jgi:hypothetical protein
MDKIVGLKISSHNLQDEKMLKEYQKQIVKKYGIDLMEYVPKGDEYIVDFELHDSNVEMASAIRRGLQEEIPIWTLSLVRETLETTDDYVLSDALEIAIRSIPINQDYFNKSDDPNKFKASISVTNQTNKYLDITTDDIKHNAHGMLFEKIQIMQLYPKKSIHFQIIAQRGYGYEDGAAFSPVANYRYDVHTDPSKQITEQMPTKFMIGYTTYRNFAKPLTLLHLLFEDLIRRINLVDREKEVVIVGTEARYQIQDSLSVSALIARQIYDLVENIEFCCAVEDGDLTSYVRIQHPDHEKLWKSAVTAVIKRIKNLDDQFK